MTESSSVNPQAVEQTKQQIRGLVEEITALSRQNLAPEKYYGEFLKRVVEALAAVGGAVWTIGEGGQFQLAYQINLQSSTLDVEGDHQRRHARLLAQVAQTREGTLVPPHSGAGDDVSAANPTEMLLVLAPLATDESTEAVVEIFQRATPQPATRRGYLRFLLQMCELAAQWLNAQKLQQLGSRQSLWMKVDDFARAAHETLDVRSTAYTVANEGQRLVGCDRVSVGVMRGGRCMIEAVSGQDAFDKRSNVVTLLGKLATRVVKGGEPLWYTGSTDELPPQIEDAVHEYVDFAHSKTIAIVPITHTVVGATLHEDESVVKATESAPPVGALIFEQIEDVRRREELAQSVDLVCSHSARALSNAVDHESLFLMPLWRTIGKSRVLVRARTLPKTLLVSLLVIGLIVSMFVIPKDFNLKGEGVLQPIERREVFVETAGTVTYVADIVEGQEIEAGVTLIQLDSTDIELELGRAVSDLNEARVRFKSISHQLSNDSSLTPEESSRLSGEQEQSRIRIESLEKQVQLLKKKKESLTIKSPISGKVISSDVKRNLIGRPVTPGQPLLTVANTKGDWELKVFMPERRMGHVARMEVELAEESQRTGGHDRLRVNYVVATDPTTTLEGEVKEVREAAELHDEHGHSVSMLVEIDPSQISDKRPGATVTATVYCGERPLGYWLFSDVIEWYYSHIAFYF